MTTTRHVIVGTGLSPDDAVRVEKVLCGVLSTHRQFLCLQFADALIALGPLITQIAVLRGHESMSSHTHGFGIRFISDVDLATDGFPEPRAGHDSFDLVVTIDTGRNDRAQGQPAMGFIREQLGPDLDSFTEVPLALPQVPRSKATTTS